MYKLLHDARHPRYPGLRGTGLGFDFARLIAQKDEIVEEYRDKKYQSLLGGKFGIERGNARFLDPHTLGFADYRGNRQYISVGNVARDDRVALIFVDYPNRARLKIFAHASLVTAAGAPGVLARLAIPGYDARVERGFVLKVQGFDWNCSQHITPRSTENEVRTSVAPLLVKIEELETENCKLRASIARDGGAASK